MTTTTTDASTRDLGEKLIMDAVALTCGDVGTMWIEQ